MTSALADRLRRPDATARLYVHADVQTASIAKQTPADWATADSTSGLTLLTDGGVQLATSGPGVVAQNATGSAFDYADPFLGPGSPHIAAYVDWIGAEQTNLELTSLTAYLHPKLSGGSGKTVATWKCQLFAPQTLYDGTVALVPLADPVYAPAVGTTAGDITFDFAALPRRPRPKSLSGWGQNTVHPVRTYVWITALKADGTPATNVGWGDDASFTTEYYIPTWVNTGLTLNATILSTDLSLTVSGFLGAPLDGFLKIDTETIYFSGSASGLGHLLTGLQRGFNGTTAAGHTAGATIYRGRPNLLGARTLTYFGPSLGWRDADTGGGVPRFSLVAGTYTAATIQFNTNDLNLGSVPATPVTFDGRADVPNGSSVAYQVLKDSGSAGTPADWLAYTDGMLSNDPAFGGHVGLRQHYQIRATLTPNADGNVTPTLRYLGVREVATTDLSDVADLVPGGSNAFDPLTLKGEIGEFTLRAIRDGDRDYLDAITTLLSNNDIGNILIRLYWGAPDLPINQWLHWDDLIIDDTTPGAGTVDLVCLSPLAQLKQALPKYDAGAKKRLPLAYPNGTTATASLQNVYLDLITNQIGSQLSATQIGPGLPAISLPVPYVRVADGVAPNPDGTPTLVLVAKTITSTDTNPRPGTPATADDAKSELDALCNLAGFTLITSQGRLKAVDVFGVQGVKVVFDPGEILPISALPGFRQRRPEAWVPWGWDGNEYPFLSYAQNAAALLALRSATVDPEPLDDVVAQWIVQQVGDASFTSSLADYLSTRTVTKFGPGLIQWTFDTTYGYPELEQGDLVAVPTDWFVAHDPIGSRPLRGVLYALAVVQRCEPRGRQFTVLVRSYSDLVGTAVPATKTGMPTISGALVPSGSNFLVQWTGNGSVQSVKITSYQSASFSLVSQALAFASAGSGTAYDGQMGSQPIAIGGGDHFAYVCVTPYSAASGGGIAGPAIFLQTQF